VSEKDAVTAKITSATVEDTVGSVPWTEPTTAPAFENKFVFEANIQQSGEDYALWHNPVTGEYDLRPISTAAKKGASD
jgi:hypothetical protein